MSNSPTVGKGCYQMCVQILMLLQTPLEPGVRVRKELYKPE